MLGLLAPGVGMGGGGGATLVYGPMFAIADVFVSASQKTDAFASVNAKSDVFVKTGNSTKVEVIP